MQQLDMNLSEADVKELERRLHRSGSFQRAFSGAEGELILKEIDMFCGYKNDGFTKDPYEHAYSAGQRSVAVFIHNILEADTKKAEEALKLNAKP